MALLPIGAFVALAAPFGLPIENTWFSGFVVGYGVNIVFGSAVSSLVEPDENSSKGYIFLYRYAHALSNRATAFAAHKSFWKFFTLAKPEGQEEK